MHIPVGPQTIFSLIGRVNVVYHHQELIMNSYFECVKYFFCRCPSGTLLLFYLYLVPLRGLLTSMYQRNEELYAQMDIKIIRKVYWN